MYGPHSDALLKARPLMLPERASLSFRVLHSGQDKSTFTLTLSYRHQEAKQ